MSGAAGRPLRLAIVAGETSGDQLGGGLMRSIRELATRASVSVEFVGIGGEDMVAAGLDPLVPLNQLAVNGFVEPLRKLPFLLALLRRIERLCLDTRIDAFIGIDFNVFNLLLESRLRKRGIRTVHYVSPSVYAWRRGRARRLARSTDLLLALYPFEPAYYRDLPIRVVHVGHPLVDAIAEDAGSDAARADARRQLGIVESLDADLRVVALLPGSRRSEVGLMAGPFFDAARIIAAQAPTVFVLPCVRAELAPLFDDYVRRYPGLRFIRYEGNARVALVACDGALVKSGTGTLEATCIGRPMVVSYRLGPWSYRLARLLVHTRFVALPNILAERAVVPELLQDDATAEKLAAALLAEMRRWREGGPLLAELRALRNALRAGEGANTEAARAVMELVAGGRR